MRFGSTKKHWKTFYLNLMCQVYLIVAVQVSTLQQIYFVNIITYKTLCPIIGSYGNQVNQFLW